MFFGVHVDEAHLNGAERVVVTAGPWARTLTPRLRGHVTVARQTVAYVRLDMPAEAHRIGLANRVVPAAELRDTVAALAEAREESLIDLVRRS